MQVRTAAIAGPHLCSGESGGRILWTHVAALWLVVVVSAAFFGWSSLLFLAGAVGTSVAVDLAMCRLLGTRNPASLPHAVLIGLLVGLTLPIMTDTWFLLQIAVIGSGIAILLGKWIFVGMGHYLWSPALVGILAVHFLFQAQVGMVGQDKQFGSDRREKYLLLSNDHLFAGDLSNSHEPEFYHFGEQGSNLLRPSNYQGWSYSLPPDPAQAWRLYRPVQILQELARGNPDQGQQKRSDTLPAVQRTLYLALPPLADAVVGCTGGGLGETSVVAILLGGLYLIYRGYVRWQLPVSFLAAAAISAAVLPMPVGANGQWLWFPAFATQASSSAELLQTADTWYRPALVGLTYVSFHLCSGGLMLAAFFLANDMATRPIQLRGQIIFGLGAGLLTIVARIYGGWPMAPLAAYSALLVMNTFTPLIDWLTKSRARGR